MIHKPDSLHGLGSILRFFLGVGGIACLGLVGRAQAVTPTAVVTCNPCSDVSTINSAASNWAYTKWTGAPGTVLLMTSLNAPMSVMYKVGAVCARRCVPRVYPQQTTNADAAALDNQVMGRAQKLAVRLPPGMTITGDDENVIIGEIEQHLLTPTGATGIDWWHGFTNFPQFAYYMLKDNSSGIIYKMYVGDTITVTDADGYSEKYQFLGIEAGTLQWKVVPNTRMLNGKPVANTTKPGQPLPGFGGVPEVGNYPGLLSNLQLCQGISSVSIELGDTVITGYGTYLFPC